ncbi:MAG: 3-hydroxylacyl-ACP dehydratase [Candidatus Dactylopiibacterium carminicum]|uniref:3-hydroxylacyl-ACP dehydratase n=2 Tax=Candidatus Dactylopiibacterium carminicum TaxID=857335 RepID=A0A272EWW1_9RHOO|nr:3-hydroxylacyl-ACP dehydratase [Candidatus Dactylopiibacterium carminicum]PAS94608.1 MAG: 3-hydroxylacyl-ACP dehydratase [Candidatus Dactylopiibacterium carminicum]PAS97647.1 MAG: 3-hydroxylacyl-ACP dehydratase [Candidatus Dactylopiibacterium carminicum]PAT00076.1 MAG: 3-hydroxylacyl-ACP dehydratase [Candidatus Dactylopiibacterium carminicum]
MCLLDGVLAWTPEAISCHAGSHRDPANPLRGADGLDILNGIEYAAQAMAIHGALRAGTDEAPRAGFLTSVREVECLASRLDDIPGALRVYAECLSDSGNHLMYSFRIETEGRPLLWGRASVMLDAAARQHA